jgi:hypothetical protein
MDLIDTANPARQAERSIAFSPGVVGRQSAPVLHFT